MDLRAGIQDEQSLETQKDRQKEKRKEGRDIIFVLNFHNQVLNLLV